ncbi:TorF family putative porin [Sphingomonadaceae bacterium G21617-S1]|nr:TorF family putative porin [Sphingomonadaceae bacterium G21617-S1]
MRASLIGLSAIALLATATPALAQDDSSDFTLTGSAALVSDYRFRGISQSGKHIAAQASATITHSSGFYGSFWASSIDDYVAAGADAELDLIGGYSTTVGGVTLDGGALYYVYSSAVKGAPTDFLELYASAKMPVGPATIKVGAAYAPKSNALSVGFGKEDNLYVYSDLSFTVPETPFGLSAHLGYSPDTTYLTGDKYLDWNVGATYTWKAATFGISYVDTDHKKGFLTNPASGKDIAKAGVVLSATYAF